MTFDGTPADTGWVALSGSTGSGVSITTRQYRVTAAGVQVRFAGTLTSALSVPVSGNVGDIVIGILPGGALPGGGGIAAIAAFPIDIGGVIAHCYIYNGGTVSVVNAEARGVAYDLGANGTEITGISPLFTVNS